MRTTHRVVADDDYLKEAQRISISQVAALRLIYQTPLIWWSCRAILVAAIIFMIEIDYARGAILPALFVLWSSIAPRTQEKSLSKARERSPVKGALVVFSLNEEGFESAAPNRTSQVKWAGVSRAILYPHGVLLELSPRNHSWLPDKSLTEGSPADLRQWLTDHREKRISTVDLRGGQSFPTVDL